MTVPCTQKNILIIGAGIAGCSLAHFLANTGWHVTLVEHESDIAQGASGNPVAAIYPKFMLNDKAHNDFMLKSFMYTTLWISQLGLHKDDYRFDGAIEILEEAYANKLEIHIAKKFTEKEKILSLLNQTILNKYGLEKNISGLFFKKGGWVNPVALCKHLIKHSNIKLITNQKISTIEKVNEEWFLKTETGETFHTLHVAICNATSINQFDITRHLHIDIFRGQMNWIHSTMLPVPSIITCDEGYLAPKIQGKHIFGATYAMNDFDRNVRLKDTRRNMDSIKKIHQAFYDHCQTLKTIPGRVSWRASTKDRKPYVGYIFDIQLLKKMRVRELAHAQQLPWLKHLYIASGFGSRGFTFAPYSTFVLANLINGHISLEDKKTLNYTNPERHRLKKMSLKKLASQIFQV